MYQDISDFILNKTNKSLHVRGEEKTVKGAAQFRSINMPDDPYIKVTFTDDSGLILIINDKLVYYSPFHLVLLESITDQQIGTIEKVKYNNDIFNLCNKNDYQFVTKLISGELLDIEGECRFSDYMTQDESKMLSLGWNSYTKERDDAYAELITKEELEIK
jgi:hypothetical protein